MLVLVLLLVVLVLVVLLAVVVLVVPSSSSSSSSSSSLSSSSSRRIGEATKVRITDKDTRDLRKKPLFAHDLWNCNDRIWEAHKTTSNAAERWHTKYNKCLPHGSAHPSMEAFLDGLHAAQRLTDLDLAKIAVGSQQRETQNSKAKRERIMTLLADFDEDRDGLKHLRAIAHLAD